MGAPPENEVDLQAGADRRLHGWFGGHHDVRAGDAPSLKTETEGYPMIKIMLISAAVYGSGCGLMMWYFLAGRTPALNERNWPWPVIFLWPLLVFWPLHALAGHYIWRRTRKRK